MIVGISMVRDEADIIENTIRHMLNQQMDCLIVSDNLSVDTTPKILENLRLEFPERLMVLEDQELGYYQQRKMNALAAQAGAMGATWIVPFDADEFWYSTQELSVATICRLTDDADILRAEVWDYTEPGHRKPEPKTFKKVAYRWHPDAILAQGNHSVLSAGSIRDGLLKVHEYQYRSVEQMIRKVRNGKQAYDATNLPEWEGAHWRELGALSDEQIAERYEQYVAEGTVTV